jgi:hypothetical protein
MDCRISHVPLISHEITRPELPAACIARPNASQLMSQQAQGEFTEGQQEKCHVHGI